MEYLVCIAMIAIVVILTKLASPYRGKRTEPDIYTGLDFSKRNRVSEHIVVTLRAKASLSDAFRGAGLAADRLMQRFEGAIDYEIQEFTPFEAGRIAYGLGKAEEDNPYHDDEELGVEWEAGYCEAFRLDREN